ncbi:MAG: signal peptidase I [Clostridiales bacterium]|nr:signal peptidase I [Clostridiales bacterium]
MEQNSQQLNINELGEGIATKRNKFWDVVLWVLIAVLAIAVIVRVFVISNVAVSGESMMETYHDGQTVVVNKLAKPKRGDVVVFYKNPVKSKFLGSFARGDSVQDGGEYYKLIKRVVALGGDKLWLESLGDGKYKLVVQTPGGDILHEDYYKKDGETLSVDCFILSDSGLSSLGRLADTTEQAPLLIEEGYFFAIGDNRANSDDSRGKLGPVPLTQLFGVVI